MNDDHEPEDGTHEERQVRKFSQEEGRSFETARLLEARAGVHAGAEVKVSWLAAQLSAPVILGGQLRHRFVCRYSWAPGMETVFQASDLELYDFSPTLERWAAEGGA